MTIKMRVKKGVAAKKKKKTKPSLGLSLYPDLDP